MKRVYTILILQRNNITQLFNKETTAIFHNYNCAFISNGYDIMRFVTCIAFKSKAERDACAKVLRGRGIDCVCRNDGLIEDKYYNEDWG